MADDLKSKVLEEYRKGNIVLTSAEGVMCMPFDTFISQPTDGLLYDLNKLEEVILSRAPGTGLSWINEFAATKVIRALKEKIDGQED